MRVLGCPQEYRTPARVKHACFDPWALPPSLSLWSRRPRRFWPPNFPLHSGDFGLHPDYTPVTLFIFFFGTNFQKLHLHLHLSIFLIGNVIISALRVSTSGSLKVIKRDR